MKTRSSAILLTVLAAFAAGAQEVHIAVQADQVLHPLSRYLTGACLEDVNHEVYGGLYSQMIFGESFQEPPATSPLQGFKAYGGTWRVQGDELHFWGTPTDRPVPAQIHLQGLVPAHPTARVVELSASLDAVNTAGQPDTVMPKHTRWQHDLKDGRTNYTFPPHSVLVMSFE